MNPHLMNLAAAFLDEYADRLGNESCNEWDWPADMPVAVRDLLVAADAEAGPERYEREADYDHVKRYGLADYSVARLLAAMIRKAAQPTHSA